MKALSGLVRRNLSALTAIACGVVLTSVGCRGPHYEANKQYRAASPADQAFLSATVERDGFKKVTRVRGQRVRLTTREWPKNEYQLIAAKLDGDARPSFFLVLITERTAWAFWKEIYDDTGKRFPGVRDSEVQHAGWVREVLSVQMSREDIERTANSLTALRVYGSRDEMQFLCNRAVATGFLKKCDETFAAPTLSAK